MELWDVLVKWLSVKTLHTFKSLYIKLSQKSSQRFITPAVKWMVIATLCLSINQSFIKGLTHIHTFEIFFFRGAITSLMCFIYLIYHSIPLLGAKHKWMLLRAFTGIFSTCVFYFSLKWMPFGAAVSLKYLSPIFAAIFAISIVKEKLRPLQWGFFSIALIGVILLKGFDERIEMIPLLLTLLASVSGGIAFIFIRKIGSSEHPLVIVNYYMFSTAVIMGLLSIPFWVTPTSLLDWGALVIIGVSGFYGQLFMTKAMQTEAVSRIVPLKYLELVYALLIGLFWFGEGYSLLSFLGIVLIMVGMLLNLMLRK